MKTTMTPFHLLVISLAGWLNREQQRILDYLKAENAVLRAQLRGMRLRLNGRQRLKLALRGNGCWQQSIVCDTSAAMVMRSTSHVVQLHYCDQEREDSARLPRHTC